MDVIRQRKRGIRDGTKVLASARGNLELWSKLARDFWVVGNGLLGFGVLFWTPLRCLLDFQVEMEVERSMNLEFR